MIAVLVTDPDLRIVRVNEAFCALTGFGAADLVHRHPPYPFWSELEADRAARYMRQAAEDGDFELTVRRRDGSFTPVAVSVASMRDRDGKLHGYMATYTQLSDACAPERLEHTLHDVAAAAAAATDDPRAVFDTIATHLAGLVGAASASVIRFEAERGVIVGASSYPSFELPDTLSMTEPSAAAKVAATGRAAKESYAGAQGEFARRARAAGLVGAIAVPVRVGDELWGCLGVAFDRPGGLPDEAERLLERFAELVSRTLINAEAWIGMREQAMSDGLTGLLNHRAFYERLASECSRARRHDRALTLCAFDLDGLKGLNDTRGHPAGDRALRTVARAILAQIRVGDVAARLGGDEFAVIAPDTDADAAFVLAERLRSGTVEVLAREGFDLTLSCGVADLSSAAMVDDLVRLADGALYHAKRHGRNRTVRYAPDVVSELSYEDALSARFLSAAEAMHMAVASKNGTARQHAEAVARLSEHVAARLGWKPERRARLREAALLHDVGKIAIPDALLTKSGRFSAEDYEDVKPHAALGAQIAEGILDQEQIAWMRAHHERPDGRGYPDGLAGAEVPDGARVIAAADAYDAITRVNDYRPPRTPAEAVDELRRHARSQFDAAVVDAIADWVAASE